MSYSGRIPGAWLRRSRVGILAFGSIAEEPGTELNAVVIQRVEVQTPFAVEFARSSRTRDGAPTLVPVSEGGAQVPAVVLVLGDSVTVADARAMLYRRETGRLDDKTADSGADWIAGLRGFAGTSTCLYTALQANIQPLTAAELAELAVRSRAAPARAERRDGISYLQQQKSRGLTTPLTPDYEKAALERTGARDLAGAWEQAPLYQALDQKEIDLAWDLVMRGLERP
jgi:mRNA-degrading endonuclease toxin of MazEF toxin-antitoxin module